MEDESAYLSRFEVRRVLNRLRRADILRLSLLAQHWASGLRTYNADDLLNEAFDRALSGRRPWPSDLSMAAFLNGIMRSVASQWRREEAREPLIEDDEDGGTEKIEGSLDPDHDLRDLLCRMRQSLGVDPQALAVFEHILADSDRQEVQTALGIDATVYDTARRRMIRHLFKNFNSGWHP